VARTPDYLSGVTVFKHAFRASIRRAYAPIEGGQSLDEAAVTKATFMKEARLVQGATTIEGVKGEEAE
jgi:hypothetical protein